MKDLFGNARRAADKAMFPTDYACALCGREIFKGFLCESCLTEVQFNNGETCPVCGRKTAKDEICLECKAHLPEFKRAVSPLVYKKGGAKLILQFKSTKPWLADIFARISKRQVELLPAPDIIVWVPATDKSVRRRGYNQAELFARKLGDVCGIPAVEGLNKIKETSVQKGLSHAQRVKNLDGCFKADKAVVKNKTVLVADDVMTTGATLDEICRTLKKAGASAVFAVTVASVENKTTP